MDADERMAKGMELRLLLKPGRYFLHRKKEEILHYVGSITNSLGDTLMNFRDESDWSVLITEDDLCELEIWPP